MKQRILEALDPWPLDMVVVYGSVAREQAQPDSDIDVAVLGQAPLSADTRLGMSAALAEATGRGVDLLDSATAHGTILAEALTRGDCLRVDSAEAYEGLMRRLVYEEADFMPLYSRLLRERREIFLHEQSGH